MAQLDNIQAVMESRNGIDKPIKIKSGEYIVRKEAVDKLGKETMDIINNADKLSYGHGGLVPKGDHGNSAIDELLALNTLAEQRAVDMTRDSSQMNDGGLHRGEGSRTRFSQPSPDYIRRLGKEDPLKAFLMQRGWWGSQEDDDKLPSYSSQHYNDGGGINDKKNRKGEYSIGVKDELGIARKQFKNIDELLKIAAMSDRYGFGKSQRGLIDVLQEQGGVNPKEYMDNVMMMLKRYREGTAHMGPYGSSSAKSYAMGGDDSSTTGTGGRSTGTHDSFIEEIYRLYGSKPDDPAIRERFQSLFGYDASDALGKVGGMIGDATTEMGEVGTEVQSYGKGFHKMGSVDKLLEDTRMNLFTGIQSKSPDIISGDRESQIAEALQYLTNLDTAGGVDFS